MQQRGLREQKLRFNIDAFNVSAADIFAEEAVVAACVRSEMRNLLIFIFPEKRLDIELRTIVKEAVL